MTKLKHASGVYKLLPDSPTPEDIKYWLSTSKKKTFRKEDVMKFFGPKKEEIIDQSLEKLEESGSINKDNSEVPIYSLVK